MPKKFTHEEFLEKLYESNSHYRNGEFEVIGDYCGLNKHIMIEDNLGRYNILANDLLKKNSKPSIYVVLDKTDYFKKEVYLKNKYYRNGDFEIVGEYLGRKVGIEILYNNLLYDISPPSLLSDYLPNLKSAKDKNLFWIEKFRISRKDFDSIDYSDVEYNSSKENTYFTCKIHNIKYSQRVYHHLNNVQGCIKCMQYPIMYNENNVSKHNNFLDKINGYLYVIKVESKEEAFYKVGITGEKRIDYRFKELEKYYNVSIEYLEEGSMVKLFKQEQDFLQSFKEFKYTPKIKFRGYTECLTTNPIAEYYNWYNN